ncbi:MotA/TolQ/ExbB proton channel family protein [Cerasicoccus fimbriatus]|uniref:MotA/TolQ/ExbB proton channel family protein n=1 Tax=Cerasicoccus fimbriatus TaxID=3014554 RepID=UPI0022B5327E|nr:MotA/TolQ/ExbB proton channel family protein [Cerasicoccus sp. TK19100]
MMLKTVAKYTPKISLYFCLILAVLLGASANQSLSAQASNDLDAALGDAVLNSTEVDWLEQISAGGFTMIALGLVSVAGCAFALERLITIRERKICPQALIRGADIFIQARDLDGLSRLAAENSSTLGRIIQFIIEHRDNDYEKITDLAQNIGAREIIDQEERNFPLAVIASVAPLLGLLGTMIGMIEAFQLVSVYGDEGGASMLAGSIAKALITTAGGLMLAIPAICAFHYFKHRLHKLGVKLDQSVEQIITGIFFNRVEQIEVEVSESIEVTPQA